MANVSSQTLFYCPGQGWPGHYVRLRQNVPATRPGNSNDLICLTKESSRNVSPRRIKTECAVLLVVDFSPEGLWIALRALLEGAIWALLRRIKSAMRPDSLRLLRRYLGAINY